ncbi:MAG: 50S ribosomal protein L3 [Candidatus Delongbacteria bacterium]|nr:50S ribosomal protein L3 [Candidatus Delongbacteria bacterium]
MKGLIGKKLGMTQLFDETGRFTPVTVLQTGPCYVAQVKKVESDGYCAVQMAFDEAREKVLTKAELGHLKKNGLKVLRKLKEFRLKAEEAQEFLPGQEIKADMFIKGEKVKVTGFSKGRGFAGVMKRHGFGGGRDSHGCKFHRKPFSIGMHTDPAKVFKNKRMPGHYGNERVTMLNLTVVNVDIDKNILLVKGAVPGPRYGYVYISKVR